MSLASDPLVTTKLRPPEARPKLVSRPRLTEKLGREPGRRLTLVSAPAGFGKTTLLTEWLETHEEGVRSVAWLSLDEGDNDPACFLSYLVAALRPAEERVGKGLLAALRSPEPPRIEALSGALVNELASVPQEWMIVLDDYGVIEAAPVHGVVSGVDKPGRRRRADGRVSLPTVFRAGNPDRPVAARYSMLAARGMSTIVDSSMEENLGLDTRSCPDGPTTAHVPLEDIGTPETCRASRRGDRPEPLRPQPRRDV